MGIRIFLSKIKNRKALLSILIIFALIFASISFVNHYLFRTYALDLGMFSHAVYNYAHLKPALFTLGLEGNDMSFLATHFSLITVFYAPLCYLFGSYTLLVIQIAAILFGGYFAYRYACQYFDQKSIIPYLVLIQFLSIWGIYSALAFDFHNNVVGAMLIPAFIYFVEKRNIYVSFLLLLLVLFTKEIMALWLVFILLGLMLKNRKTLLKSYYKFEIPMLLFCLAYGISIIFYVMPSLQGVSDNLQLSRYNHLGDSVFEIAINFIKNPQLLLDTLFTNTLNHPAFDNIKAETYVMFLLAGGIFCVLRPAFLIMVIPIFCLKFFSNDYGFWGISGQYSIEFVPIISFATISFLKDIQKYKAVLISVMTIVLFLTMYSNYSTIEGRYSQWYNPLNTKFYGKAHYKTELNIREVRNTLKLIEKNSVVSASSSIIPHIAMRDRIYHFPVIKDSKYIVLFKNRDFWPFSEDDFKGELEKLKSNGDYTIFHESDDLILFKAAVVAESDMDSNDAVKE